MVSQSAHAARVADQIARLDQTTGRFVARLARAGDRGQQAASGWTPAQIAEHVAMVNAAFAAMLDGSAPGATPPAEGFVERPFEDIIRGAPPRLDAPARVVPPVTVTMPDAVEHLRLSTEKLRTAISRLTPERSTYCFTHRALGTMTLAQVGDFAIAHMIRHNQQAKRTLGE